MKDIIMTEHISPFVDFVVSIKRVTKVTKGGKRFQFAAFVVSGDQKGNVGIALGKGRDVTAAIAKAQMRARKTMFSVQLREETLCYDVQGFHGASKVIFRPAYKGTGLIAGGAVRAVMKALGVKDVLAKCVGTSASGQNVVKATLNALAQCRSIAHLAKVRGKSIDQVIKGGHNA
jgi:small subunit ribosomal protein S5